MQKVKAKVPVAVQNEGEVGAGKLLPFPQSAPVADTVYLDEREDAAHVGTLTIRGDSLVGAGLLNGDTAICRKVFRRADIKPNTICVVYIIATGELVAKRLRFSEGRVILCSVSAEHADRYFQPDEVDIRGIIIGYQRMAEASGCFPSPDDLDFLTR